METLIIVLIVILLILVLIFFGIIILLGMKLLKQNQIRESQENPVQITTESSISGLLAKEDFHKDAQEQISMARSMRGGDIVGIKCMDHPESSAKGVCSISDEPYCELCITTENEVRFARKFLDLYLDSKWEVIYFVNNESLGRDKVQDLYKTKKSIWKESETPLITQKQYKINIESDEVELYTMVMARDIDHEVIKEKLNFLEE